MFVCQALWKVPLNQPQNIFRQDAAMELTSQIPTEAFMTLYSGQENKTKSPFKCYVLPWSPPFLPPPKWIPHPPDSSWWLLCTLNSLTLYLASGHLNYNKQRQTTTLATHVGKYDITLTKWKSRCVHSCRTLGYTALLIGNTTSLV